MIEISFYRFNSDIKKEVYEGCRQSQLVPVQRAETRLKVVRLAASNRTSDSHQARPLNRGTPECLIIRGQVLIASPPL